MSGWRESRKAAGEGEGGQPAQQLAPVKQRRPMRRQKEDGEEEKDHELEKTASAPQERRRPTRSHRVEEPEEKETQKSPQVVRRRPVRQRSEEAEETDQKQEEASPARPTSKGKQNAEDNEGTSIQGQTRPVNRRRKPRQTQDREDETEMETMPGRANLDDTPPTARKDQLPVSVSPTRMFQPPTIADVVCDDEDIVGDDVAATGPSLHEKFGMSVVKQSAFTEVANGFRPVRRKEESIVEGHGHRSKETNGLQQVFETVSLLIASAFVFAQGLLGGASMCVILLALLPSRTQFLQAYGGVGIHIQRCFFVLSTVCIVGGLEKYNKDRRLGWHPHSPTTQRLYDGLIILSYVACFVFSIFCAPMDELVYISQRRVRDWYDFADLDSTFVNNLNAWQGLNAARCIAGLFGWLLLSLEVRTYIHTGPSHVLNTIYEYVYMQKQEVKLGVPQQQNAKSPMKS